MPASPDAAYNSNLVRLAAACEALKLSWSVRDRPRQRRDLSDAEITIPTTSSAAESTFALTP